MAPKKIRSVVRKFRQALCKAQFPPMQMMIFGSYARNEARADSDIDICLISRAFSGDDRENYRVRAIVIAYGVDPRLQVVTVSPTDLQKNRLSPLFDHIRKEAIAT